MTNEELVLAIQAGQNVTENMEQLYYQNKGMIYKLTERYKGVEDPEDLRQEAYFGLARAAQLWSPGRDTQFITYAVLCIKTHLQRYIADCGALIRIPGYQKAMIYKYKQIVNAYRVEFGRYPEPLELRTLLEISKDQLEQLKKDVLATGIKSINAPIVYDDEELTLEDTLASENDPIEEVVDRIYDEEVSRALWEEVDNLSDREAQVVRSKYQDGKTYAECGEALGLSIERVRQIHEKALRKLRDRKVAKRLSPYLPDSEAYTIGTRGSLSSFRLDHTSSQERAVMFLEDRTGPIWRRSHTQEDLIFG